MKSDTMKSVLMAAVALMTYAGSSKTNAATNALPHVRWTKVISALADRYCGWPTVTAVGPNELVALFSGDRAQHVCPWGRVKMLRSTDGGETWTPSVDIVNGLLDDRDAGLVKLANGDWLVFWFTSIAFTHASSTKNNPDWKRHYEKMPSNCVRCELGSFVSRSTDGGKTWGSKVRVPVSAPHGGIQLRDGRLLVIGNQDSAVRGHLSSDPEERGHGSDGRRIQVAESKDNGASWQLSSEIPAQIAPQCYFCEPHLTEGADGVLRCYIRDVNLAYSESRDGGKTWSAMKATSIEGWDSPPHLTRLQDGRMLLTCGRRVNWSVKEKDVRAKGHKTCVFALIGDENGSLESFERAKEIPVYFTENSDMGYPSTAQTADGSLVTVLYAHHGGDPAACVVAVKWQLP